MSIPSLVPVFDLEAFEDIAYDLAFQLEITNADGTSQDPAVYKDLTNKAVIFIIDDIFRDRLTLEEGTNANGSILSVDADRTLGKFQFHLSADEMALARKTIGYQHLILHEAGQDDEVMWRGTFRVLPFNAEGEL
jgi:hypothetical protein